MESNRHENIEVLAFLIWEKNGRVEGRALNHWLEAEYLIHTSSFMADEAASEPECVDELARGGSR